jgi:hypothetical protein
MRCAHALAVNRNSTPCDARWQRGAAHVAATARHAAALCDVCDAGLNYLRTLMGIEQPNYPEMGLRVFIINAPRVFSLIWKVPYSRTREYLKVH